MERSESPLSPSQVASSPEGEIDGVDREYTDSESESLAKPISDDGEPYGIDIDRIENLPKIVVDSFVMAQEGINNLAGSLQNVQEGFNQDLKSLWDRFGEVEQAFTTLKKWAKKESSKRKRNIDANEDEAARPAKQSKSSRRISNSSSGSEISLDGMVLEIPFTDELCAKLSAKQSKNAKPTAAKKTRKIRNVVLVKAKNPEAAIPEAAKPEAAKPEAAIPEAAMPKATKPATVKPNTEPFKLNAASLQRVLESRDNKTPQAGVAEKKTGQSDHGTPGMPYPRIWQPRKDWHVDENEPTELKDDGDDDNDDDSEDGPAPGGDALQILGSKASTKPTEKGKATQTLQDPARTDKGKTPEVATGAKNTTALNHAPSVKKSTLPPGSLGNPHPKPKEAAAKPQDTTKAPLISHPPSSFPPKPDPTKTQPPTLQPDDELSDLSDYTSPTPPEDYKQSSPLIKKEYSSDDEVPSDDDPNDDVEDGYTDGDEPSDSLPSDDDPDDDVKDGYTDDGGETNSGFGSLA